MAEPTASPPQPEFSDQLGQLAKFYRLMGFTPEETQVVINDPEARAIVKRTWVKVISPPSVRLVAIIYAQAKMPLADRHRLARDLRLNDYLSGLPRHIYDVINLIFGLTEDRKLATDEVCARLGLVEAEVRELHRGALAKLRMHLERIDHDVARLVPLVPDLTLGRGPAGRQ